MAYLFLTFPLFAHQGISSVCGRRLGEKWKVQLSGQIWQDKSSESEYCRAARRVLSTAGPLECEFL